MIVPQCNTSVVTKAEVFNIIDKVLLFAEINNDKQLQREIATPKENT